MKESNGNLEMWMEDLRELNEKHDGDKISQIAKTNQLLDEFMKKIVPPGKKDAVE